MFDIQRMHCASPHTPKARMVLAHGAGAGMEHDFMQNMAEQLASHGIEVVLFNFPYMQTMNAQGKRRPPNKADVLTAHFRSLLEHIANDYPLLPTFIGGKSMGGRMATMVANEVDCKGVVAFGYPFHPPGKPEKTRTAHLPDLTAPLCIIQGERDTFGNQNEVAEYALGDQVQCHFLKDGDHSFKPRKASGHTQQQHIEHAASLCAAFIEDAL